MQILYEVFSGVFSTFWLPLGNVCNLDAGDLRICFHKSLHVFFDWLTIFSQLSHAMCKFALVAMLALTVVIEIRVTHIFFCIEPSHLFQ